MNDLLSLATLAAQRASRLCQAVRRDLVTSATKDDRSPVTVADFGAQAVVSLTLAEGGSDLPMVGEEDAAMLRAENGRELCNKVVAQVRGILGEDISTDTVLDAIDAGSDPGGATGQRWVLDPIDGTKGFLRGEQYAVALALLDDGVPSLGVLGCPWMPVRPDAEGDIAAALRGVMFSASRGQGARQVNIAGWTPQSEGNTIRASQIDDPRQASFCESVEAAHSAHDDHSKIATVLGVEATPVRMDSQCKYAAVARGQASIYLRLPKSDTYREKIWDHAAGVVVVEEAGGRVTDVRGESLDFSIGRTLDRNRGVIATNGLLHDKVLGAVQQVLA